MCPMLVTAARNVFIAVALAIGLALVSPARVAVSAPAHEALRVERFMAPPKETELMRMLDLRLQRLKPYDILYRTILFDQIVPGTSRDGVYPFVVSLTIHDYSAGWPPNGYFGKTCISKLERGTFTMKLTVSHEWSVDGPITVTEPLCQPNPADKVSAFPLAEIPGKRLSKSLPPAEVPRKRKAGVLLLGDYACMTKTGRMLDNMRFRLKKDQTYTDLSGENGGKYVLDIVAGSVAFRGGFLDGRVGKDVDLMHFAFPDLACDRWQ